MYDPSIVAFEIKSPFRRKPDKLFPRGYRNSLVTIWHIDPEDARGMCVRRGDDTCGWFTPPYPAEARDRIRKLGERQYSTIFNKQWAAAEKKDYVNVCYEPTSYDAIYWAWRAIKHEETKHGVWQYDPQPSQGELARIYELDANPVDNLRGVVEDVRDAATCASFFMTVYSCYLRYHRPWYKHPRWHFWHWRFQVHSLQKLTRRLFARCAVCSEPFGWNESPIGNWEGTKVWHSRCSTSGTKVPDAQADVFRPLAPDTARPDPSSLH